ncbi:putative ankyrin repeat domain-containing protein 28 protein [Neofusicoccum parvum]|nr:putative ankyrin repeat domain-containing protein 28 protein [Neofusicoccum parvum]
MELAAAVVSLSCKAVIVANDLYELRSKYKDAGTTIDAICNEVEVVRASLSRVQRLLEKDSAKGIDFNDELRDVFDMAITGCTVVLSCLDDEIKKLLAGSKSQGGGGGFGWKVKAKYLWREETMMDLLQKLRGQQGAISLLFQSLQMESLSELHHLLRERSTQMHQSQAAADSLRQAHPEVDVPESILCDLDSERGSILSTTEFSFDDEIINSKAYRRALSMAHHHRRPKSPDLDLIPENEPSEPSSNTTTHSEEAAEPVANPPSPPPTTTDPPPAYSPPLPPPAAAATTPPTDPLSAAISKSLASFHLLSPTHHAQPPPNRPPIPSAPPLLDPDPEEDPDSTSSRPPSYTTLDRCASTASTASTSARGKRDKAARRRARDKAARKARGRCEVALAGGEGRGGCFGRRGEGARG